MWTDSWIRRKKHSAAPSGIELGNWRWDEQLASAAWDLRFCVQWRSPGARPLRVKIKQTWKKKTSGSSKPPGPVSKRTDPVSGLGRRWGWKRSPNEMLEQPSRAISIAYFAILLPQTQLEKTARSYTADVIGDCAEGSNRNQRWATIFSKKNSASGCHAINGHPSTLSQKRKKN